MRNVVLRAGSSGPLVRDLQERLDHRLNPSPDLKLNGFFSARTEQALMAFQRCLWLEPTGIAEQCSLDPIFDTELEPPILHNLPYINQLTPNTRWAAATAMLSQSSVQHVRRLTPEPLLANTGALKAFATREERVALYLAFARAHKLTYHAPQSWPVGTLVEMLRAGPIMLEIVQPIATVRRGSAANGLYLVVTGARGSHEPDGRTTTLRLHDPDDSQGRGIQSVLYANFLRRIQFGSFGIFTR